MATKRTLIIGACCFLIVQSGYSQATKDTSAMIKEFNKVISFAVQPYLFYKTVTRMNALPVLERRDTAIIDGIFYKKEANLYYKSGNEEIYLEDSLLVQINEEQKSIWIRKVDMASRDKLDILPLGNKKMQELFKKNYTIGRSVTGDNTARMNFQSKQAVSNTAGITTDIGLEYLLGNYQPLQMNMEIKMQELASDELLAALRTEGINDPGLVETINDVRYVIRKQRVSISFSEMDTSREKAMQMPSWKAKLEYNGDNGEFSGKGVYSEYEVTKTF